jgi:hypothetical protein
MARRSATSSGSKAMAWWFQSMVMDGSEGLFAAMMTG